MHLPLTTFLHSCDAMQVGKAGCSPSQIQSAPIDQMMVALDGIERCTTAVDVSLASSGPEITVKDSFTPWQHAKLSVCGFRMRQTAGHIGRSDLHGFTHESVNGGGCAAWTHVMLSKQTETRRHHC